MKWAMPWGKDDSPQLSHKGKDLLEADNALLLSIASLWEIAIKLRLGKLTVAVPIEVLMTQQLTHNDAVDERGARLRLGVATAP